MNRPDLNKAISIKQPWAYLICAGIKDVENRTWATKYRGRVYIHASAKSACNNGCSSHLFTEQQIRAIKQNIPAHPDLDKDFQGNSYSPFFFEEHQLSAIIGQVDIVNCISKARNGKGSVSIWAEPNCFHWILRNPVLFDKPILNVKGKLSFWDCSEYLTDKIDVYSNVTVPSVL